MVNEAVWPAAKAEPKLMMSMLPSCEKLLTLASLEVTELTVRVLSSNSMLLTASIAVKVTMVCA